MDYIEAIIWRILMKDVITRILNYCLIGLLIILGLTFVVGCHHHSNPTPLPAVDNPASYNYAATLVASHQPGFFSCCNMNGRILEGTYQDYHNKMHCQLCELINGNQVKVLNTFEGESVYHVRPYDTYVLAPVEQGNMYSVIPGQAPILMKKKSWRMGYYDAFWYKGHCYTLEKANIYPPSKVAIYQDGKPWFYGTGWKAKDMLPLNDKIYLSATSLNNRTEAAIVSIDIATKAVKFFKSFRWCWTGGLGVYDNAVWASFDCNGTFYNTKGEEFHLGNHGWFIGPVGETLFATTGGKWRGVGPSHLWVFNPESRQFEKKLDIPDAEAWSICKGPTSNSFYLVTRNEHENNLGRIYLITRVTK